MVDCASLRGAVSFRAYHVGMRGRPFVAGSIVVLLALGLAASSAGAQPGETTSTTASSEATSTSAEATATSSETTPPSSETTSTSTETTSTSSETTTTESVVPET